MFGIIIRKLIYSQYKIKQFFYLRWNKLLFNLCNIEYNEGLKVYNKIHLFIDNSAKVKIGENFKFTSSDAINPLSRNIQGCICATKNAQIIIGNNVGISSACIWSKEKIHIGNNVLIGGDCILLDTDAHNLNFRIRASGRLNETGINNDYATANSAPIHIGDNVLIGTRCIILKGVSIGNKTIIGSGSVVTKSIPDNCIAAGNPCRIIKKLEE